MNKNTFLGLLDTQIEAVKNATAGKNENEIILKTIKLLMEQLNYSDSVLSEYERLEMRKLFAFFGSIAQAACDFYEASKEHLDPTALQGEIGRKLENAKNEVNRVNALIEAIERDSVDLLEQENELIKKNAEYNKIQQKISELQEIYEIATDERIQSLKIEEEQLSSHIKQNKKEAANLESTIKEYKMDLVALQESSVRLHSKQKTIEENIIATIQQKHDKLHDIYTRRSHDLEHITSEIERYKTLYSNLSDDLSKAEETHRIYALHLGENSDITRKLQEHGISSVESLLVEVQKLESSIKTEISRFDHMLRDVILQKEKMKEEIETMQGKR